MQNQQKAQPSMLSVYINSSDIVQNGVMYLNADGHILGVNEQFANELGYSKANFAPKTIFEVSPNTSFLGWKKLWKQLLAEKKIKMETEQITIKGTIYPVKIQIVLFEADGEMYCVAVVENLMESNRYKDLLNLASEVAGLGCWEWDLVRDSILFTEAMYELLEIPLDSQLDKAFFDKFLLEKLDPTEAGQFRELMEKAIKDGQIFEMELSIKKNGRFENFNLNAHPVFVEDNSIKVYGTLQDLAKVTERTDDLYFTKFAMDNARDMIFWLKPNGEITYVNQTSKDVLGYSAEELIGQNIKFLAKFSKVDQEAYWKRLKREKSIEFESIHVAKDGKKIPVSIISNYINYRGREFNCGFVRNLTYKKDRDELISMAKSTLDNSIDMIFWLRPDGTFRYCNESFKLKTGYTAKEINQMTVFDFIQDKSIEILKQEWKKLQSENVLLLKRNLKTKAGSTIPVEMVMSIVKVNDHEYSTHVLRDITNQLERETRIQNQIDEIAVMQKAAEAENIELKEEINLEFNFNNIVTRDPNYKKVLRQIEQVADTDATVLILGETGTGKELLARAIHQLSERADMPMIKVNCGALPENLIESEFFGHERGAFTGAHQRKIGKFERADKGTIFLDEIGELPLDLQAKLLRVLQEGEFERVGGTELLTVDVRIIAATNRDLEKRVEKGRFREDLFYRLNVFPIYNIPLRERREDIPVLVKHFSQKYSAKLNKQIDEIPQAELNKLMAYEFLGNVRELENIVERAVILSRSNKLTFDKALGGTSTGKRPAQFLTLEDMQRNHILDALKRTKGKVSGNDGAAKLLGINDKTLTSRMKKLNIDRRDYLKL